MLVLYPQLRQTNLETPSSLYYQGCVHQNGSSATEVLSLVKQTWNSITVCHPIRSSLYLRTDPNWVHRQGVWLVQAPTIGRLALEPPEIPISASPDFLASEGTAACFGIRS